MGGSGSTRWEGYERRPTVSEAHERITLDDLKAALRRADFRGTRRGRVARVPWLQWTLPPIASDGSRVLYVQRTAPPALETFWPEDADPIASVMAEALPSPRVTVQCVATGGRYGGRRWWFACPLCGRRCRALFVRGTDERGAPRFRCRRCAGVGYATQLADPLKRAEARVASLEKRLGLNSLWPTRAAREPRRPRRMHRRTFARLLAELEAARAARDAIWLREVSAMLESLDPLRARIHARLDEQLDAAQGADFFPDYPCEG